MFLRILRLDFALVLAVSTLAGSIHAESSAPPVPLIFDTDIGNDVDDVLALGMIHALQSRGYCQLLAVTITKDNPLASRFADCVNTFYGRGDIPIGVARSGITPEAGKFNILAEQRDGDQLRYPHDLDPKTAPDAVAVLRQALAQAADHSVVMAQVGFSTNYAKLLVSEPDEQCPLSGKQLIERKVRLLSIMAGSFELATDPKAEVRKRGEYNIIKDIPAAQSIASAWPTEIVWSGWEIGVSLPYPAESILKDYNYVVHHPLAEAYHLYNPPPHNRPTWDLTSVIYGVLPDHEYVTLSEPGTVIVTDQGFTTFERNGTGRHRFMLLTDAQRIRLTEALVQLSSQPPQAGN